MQSADVCWTLSKPRSLRRALKIFYFYPGNGLGDWAWIPNSCFYNYSDTPAAKATDSRVVFYMPNIFSHIFRWYNLLYHTLVVISTDRGFCHFFFFLFCFVFLSHTSLFCPTEILNSDSYYQLPFTASGEKPKAYLGSLKVMELWALAGYKYFKGCLITHSSALWTDHLFCVVLQTWWKSAWPMAGPHCMSLTYMLLAEYSTKQYWSKVYYGIA